MLKDINIHIDDRGTSNLIQDCGTGLQSLTIIGLHRFIASLKRKKVIIGIEEPESNLHPQSQRELVKSFKDSSLTRESQIIFTTHSSTIVDELSHEEIILCRSIFDSSRGFRTVLYQLPLDFWTKYNIEEFKYYKYHKYSNSEFFFAQKVIIVESKIDAEVVKTLLEQKNVDADSEETAIINLEGVKNLKYPYYLLKELSFQVFLVLDKDYFLPYINGSLKNSRDSVGFPKYTYEYKGDCLIKSFMPNKENRTKLLNLFRTNHSKALSLLANYNIICFKHCLEIDIISSSKGADLYYEKLKIPEGSRNRNELLIKRKNQIKEAENILHVVKQMPHQNLPNSYKRIKSSLISFIKQKI